MYDPNILCLECERKFDAVDAYGARTLLHTLRGDVLKPIRSSGPDVIAFQAHGIDQERLRRFFIATLWRASVSTQPFFDRVHLGARYENLARDSVACGPLTSDFGVAMSGWLSPDGRDENIGFMDPFAERYDGVRTYRFPFGRFTAYMKVDKQPFREPLTSAALGAQQLLTIIRRDHSKSKDFAAMVSTVKRQHRNSMNAKAISPNR